MRGKGSCEELLHLQCGITPAYAGKSTGNRLTIHIKRDHPPPMRGKAAPSFPTILSVRITPAYAGKS